MKRMVAGIVVGVLLAGLRASAEEAAAPASTNQPALTKPQTMCPIMTNNAVSKKLYTDYKGKRVYFCCGGCPPAFAKDPDKYIKQMQDAGIKLEDAPKAMVPKAEAAKP